jgi:translation initiation factor 3 subunit L
MSSEEREVPDNIKHAITGLKQAIGDVNIGHMVNNYETYWNKTNDKYKGSQTEWPTAEKIAPLVGDDELFLYLYKELYYRNLYSTSKNLSVEQRLAAWENYSSFFDFLLVQKKPLQFELPLQWIWDIIDEFVYQFQEFCQYRSKLTDDGELHKLKGTQAWHAVSVLKYLQRFITISDIVNTLERERSGTDSANQNNPFATHILYQYFGYFSIISLCRLHVILSDYYMALKTIEPIELHKKRSRYTKVTAAHITLFYYTGFTYLMVRRYQDAIKMFTTVLLYISRMKQYHTRQYDQKKNEKMYALLGILLHFCPKRIDDHLNSMLMNSKVLSSKDDDLKDIEQHFSYGCPKFVSPVGPSGGDEVSQLALQRKLFMKEITQQSTLPLIRSYLKLYTTIDINKLSNLLDKKHDKETLLTYLVRFVHKNRQLQWSNGMKPNEGTLTSSTNLDFYIDEEMIHVIDSAVTKRYAEVFLRNCDKLEEIIADLQKQTK